MLRQIVECVPNFSEGRDPAIVARIAEAIAQVRGAEVLGRTWDCDHNRSVITFAGAPAAVTEGAFRGIECAVKLIDMNRHHGVHPRVGAADVVPLVPVAGVTLEDCVCLAGELGARVWRELRVPVYLYEAAARRPERVNLANIRRGRWETLRDEIGVLAERAPDIGEARLHPTAGACVIGARKFLIAFNINLATGDPEIGRRIARKIRFSSGGLPCVKALGFFLESRGIAQVSINLTDYEVTPLCTVIEAVRAEAERAGVGIKAMELIGLIPRKAIETARGCELQFENFNDGLIVEHRLEQLPY
ncbi:MAG TPA: glutamate formimidoyltransferase [Bryobacteraceae bacterium]|nr:glutamate formimidoyltransferase [Bryobacteraceae bacterium]